jgi:hypothetical protein
MREQEARAAAEVRILAAEKRVREATSSAEKVARRLEDTKRKQRRHHRRRGAKAHTEGLGELFVAAEPIVRSGIETARAAGVEAAKRSRRATRQARQSATRTLERAKDAAASTKDAVQPKAERVVARAGDAIDHLTGD